MHFLLQKNLDIEFDNKDNIIKIMNQHYQLFIKPVIMVDWEFKEKEILTWHIILLFNQEYDKDPTTKIFYTYLNKEFDSQDKHLVLNQIKNLFLDISNKKLILTKKDINLTQWVRCEELVFIKNF